MEGQLGSTPENEPLKRHNRGLETPDRRASARGSSCHPACCNIIASKSRERIKTEKSGSRRRSDELIAAMIPRPLQSCWDEV
jgi:hypothetical protein